MKQKNTELGSLMHDLRCKNASEIHSKILAERVYELKETQKGADLMCREKEKFYNDGMSIDKITRLIKISAEEVREWLDEIHVI